MIDIETIESFYIYFYCHKYNENGYIFKRTKTTKSVCESFLKILDKKYSLVSLGREFLWDYFLYQLNYWHELTLENSFSDKTQLSYIIGKKAFERWETRDKEYDWLIENYSIIKLYSLEKNDLFTNYSEKPSKKYDASKGIRKQYLNTERGFAMCIEFTTLFNPTDLSCIKCNNRVDCKELLKQNYPAIYKERLL